MRQVAEGCACGFECWLSTWRSQPHVLQEHGRNKAPGISEDYVPGISVDRLIAVAVVAAGCRPPQAVVLHLQNLTVVVHGVQHLVLGALPRLDELRKPPASLHSSLRCASRFLGETWLGTATSMPAGRCFHLLDDEEALLRWLDGCKVSACHTRALRGAT